MSTTQEKGEEKKSSFLKCYKVGGQDVHALHDRGTTSSTTDPISSKIHISLNREYAATLVSFRHQLSFFSFSD
jgi:hypothetical protein